VEKEDAAYKFHRVFENGNRWERVTVMEKESEVSRFQLHFGVTREGEFKVHGLAWGMMVRQ